MWKVLLELMLLVPPIILSIRPRVMRSWMSRRWRVVRGKVLDSFIESMLGWFCQYPCNKILSVEWRRVLPSGK